jgi:predicted O-methyltransferase YrrM
MAPTSRVVTMDDYQFTSDWFGGHIPTWTRLLGGLAGKRNVRVLEVGAYEGRATVWLLGNVLTHETARIECVDPFFDPDYSARFDHNIKTALGRSKVKKVAGRSQDILRRLKLDHYDVIYIDGSHAAADVLEDAVLSFRLLKRGGVMIFDDYLWNLHLDPWMIPKPAIDAFLAIYQGQYELLEQGYQVAIKRR